MKILLCGGSGFLGQYINKVLAKEEVTTLGPNRGQLKVDLALTRPCFDTSFDMVVHAAGKAHEVPTSVSSRAFYDINVRGTENLLKGLESSQIPKFFIFISSVAVYGLNSGQMITELEALKASDAYGKSKIIAEELVQDWCSKNSVLCSVLRLPLIAGVNPPGNLGAMIRGVRKGYYFNIAGGCARKSMVLAEDVARVIPKVAEIGGTYNLTDGYHPSFSELSELVAMHLGKKKPANLPFFAAWLLAKAGDIIGPNSPFNSNKLVKITSDLTFDDSKARRLVGWKPTCVLDGLQIE